MLLVTVPRELARVANADLVLDLNGSTAGASYGTKDIGFEPLFSLTTSGSDSAAFVVDRKAEITVSIKALKGPEAICPSLADRRLHVSIVVLSERGQFDSPRPMGHTIVPPTVAGHETIVSFSVTPRTAGPFTIVTEVTERNREICSAYKTFIAHSADYLLPPPGDLRSEYLALVAKHCELVEQLPTGKVSPDDALRFMDELADAGARIPCWQDRSSSREIIRWWAELVEEHVGADPGSYDKLIAPLTSGYLVALDDIRRLTRALSNGARSTAEAD